ncbi:MAG: GNAT family N-acetyltransferase [Cyanobacteriota/Melainabacteria group bacterium]
MVGNSGRSEDKLGSFLEKFADTKKANLFMWQKLSFGKIAAFGAIVPANNELRAVYVSPRFARQAIGSRLLAHLERQKPQDIT